MIIDKILLICRSRSQCRNVLQVKFNQIRNSEIQKLSLSKNSDQQVKLIIYIE
ncbi:hypothetical protein HanXRQr2_Chr11g0508871 [Helianthus annuus]|uniref:Uncharacterized protein n=1 Tax=Helianthus annuus TaxID=4232 RepID=A0A251TDD4_HELAN|nr:hypothetical protein HanXRQr2_Chr11g0508871 [Helianthus annuus]KAJ0876592.1 hypothetical protein HanPSC8_Chr11g0490201 [Helianthus annuus]